MILVDTAYFVALANPRDEHHLQAQAWTGELEEPLLVTEYVLWETVNALSRVPLRARAHDVVVAVQTEAQFEFVSASSALLRAGLALHRQSADKAWSLTDCISFHVMKERAVHQALTHDHHFEQAGFVALLRSAPS